MAAPEKNESWKPVVIALGVATVGAIPPTLMALAAFNKAGETHNLVNSRMTEMLIVVKAAATAEATLKEKALEKARKGAAAEVALETLPNHYDKERKTP